MRILYILSNSRAFDGSSKSFLNLFKGIVDAGMETMVLFPDNKDMYQSLSGLGIKTFFIKYEFDVSPKLSNLRDFILYIPRIIRRNYLNRKAINQIVDICKRYKPDLIHTNVSPLTVGYKVAMKLGIPHLFHVREYADKDFNLNIQNVNEILNKSYTISITKDIARYRNLNDPIKDRVIYNGIFSRKDLKYSPNKSPFFLYAGRLTEKKGFKMMMEAYIDYASSTKNPFKILIAGIPAERNDIEMVDNLKEKIHKNRLSEHVVWLGVVDSVSEYMYKAKATIVPSFNEGFGRVVAEAMFNGCLVIGYDAGGIKEQFDNGLHLSSGEIGLRFSSKDELVVIFKNLEQELIDIKPYIQRSQECVCELYSTENNVKKTLEFYHAIESDCNHDSSLHTKI